MNVIRAVQRLWKWTHAEPVPSTGGSTSRATQKIYAANYRRLCNDDDEEYFWERHSIQNSYSEEAGGVLSHVVTHYVYDSDEEWRDMDALRARQAWLDEHPECYDQAESEEQAWYDEYNGYGDGAWYEEMTGGGDRAPYEGNAGYGDGAWYEGNTEHDTDAQRNEQARYDGETEYDGDAEYDAEVQDLDETAELECYSSPASAASNQRSAAQSPIFNGQIDRQSSVVPVTEEDTVACRDWGALKTRNEEDSISVLDLGEQADPDADIEVYEMDHVRGWPAESLDDFLVGFDEGRRPGTRLLMVLLYCPEAITIIYALSEIWKLCNVISWQTWLTGLACGSAVWLIQVIAARGPEITRYPGVHTSAFGGSMTQEELFERVLQRVRTEVGPDVF